MSKELPHIKVLMLAHLQELIEDGERYSWSAIMAHHATWVQHIEQSLAAWGDEENMKLRRVPMWHWVGPLRPSTTHSQGPSQQACQTSTNPTRRGTVFSKPTEPGDKVCINFNKGTCHRNADYPSFLHVCSYCLYTVQHLCHHTEQFCNRKALPKKGAGGV